MAPPDKNTLRQMLEGIVAEVQSRHGAKRSERQEALWGSLARKLTLYAKLSIRSVPGLKPADAEDLGQWLLLRLQDVRVAQRVLESRNVTAYVLRVLRNEAARIASARQSERDAIAKSRERGIGSGTSSLDPELPGYLRRLPRADRELLAMRFWGNLSVDEVANRLGISYSAAAVRYFRLFHRLRKDLEP